MKSDQLRKKFLSFFAKRGHTIIPSASLVPEHDPTVLFTTAGMHPLVPYLLGQEHPGGKRLANVQKCLRTDDIDNVGDAVHNTFFEMLGNWSLGDYGKEEAIYWSWEFLTDELGLDKNRLAASVFGGEGELPADEESAEIWKKIGIPANRIFAYGKAENFWGPVGKTGPAGPDTEMFYYLGQLSAMGKHQPGKSDEYWVEVGNDVFMEYNKTEKGKYEFLKQKNVDTGMGLERILMILNKKMSVYETDVFVKIYAAIEKKATRGQLRLTRIIADHLRAATFLIAAAVEPSNVDRGYILRRLIRRAIRAAHRSGIEWGFNKGIAQVVIENFGPVYSELGNKEDGIYQVLKEEEERFRKPFNWIEQYRLDLQAAAAAKFIKRIGAIPILEKPQVASGRYVFENYQTYGVPPDLAEDIAAELGLDYDRGGFDKAMRQHQLKSRAATAQKFAGGLADHSEQVIKCHTATHLLHQALRDVLGFKVHQTGSNITSERIRFDFCHDQKMTDDQIAATEAIVNQKIKASLPIRFEIMSLEDAKKAGAIGLFDQKYGDKVKVYFIGDYSTEFCAGPHVTNTGMVKRFKILKEESAGAGVRRIYAVCLT